MLLHFYGGPLLGIFLAMMRLFSSGSNLGFILTIEGSPMELVMWLAAS